MPTQQPPCLNWAPPEQRPRLIFVYCTYPVAYWLLDQFFLAADRPPACGLDFSLCFVRNHEEHRYEPRRRDIRSRGGMWFVYEDELRNSSPASLFDVSIELDEHTHRDERSCLLRKNGWAARDRYGEVRCEFRGVLDTALMLWGRKHSLSFLQSQAAIHGGVLPARDRWMSQGPHKPPAELFQRNMPRVWRKRGEGSSRPCPVFVTGPVSEEIIDMFLDAVNFRSEEPEHRVRVQVIDINLETDVEFSLIDEAPTSHLSYCFRRSTIPAILSFMRHRCRQADLSAKHFVILDQLTMERLPCMTGRDDDAISLRRLSCMIGDMSVGKTGRPLLLRCSFGACAAILDDIMCDSNSINLDYYADSAAVDYGGCFRYKISEETCRTLGSLINGSAAQETINSRIVDERVSDGILELLGETSAMQTNQATVQRSKTGNLGDRPKTPEHDYEYARVSQSRALGLTQPSQGSGWSHMVTLYGPHGRMVRPGFGSSPLASSGPGPASSGTEPKRVDSFFDSEVSDDDDEWFDMLFPEVTGLTQMSCA